MIRLANPLLGEVFVDNMCGSGSIPFEGSRSFGSGVCFLGGDISVRDVTKAAAIRAADSELSKVEIATWNACRLPMRSASVDAIVSDFPFGRRHG
eukprot:SAG31_NODE_3738_length_3934_cov_9.760626_2_plen_95_part_00